MRLRAYKLAVHEKEALHGHVRVDALLARRVRIGEVEKRERAKRELDELIRKKSEEAKGWNEQTEAQRQAFLETAVSAMSKGSRGTFWWGLVLGFALNLLATLTWTLLGNPGKDDILRKFEEVTHIFR